MNRFITTVFCLLLSSIPAQAQQPEFTPGLNYTTLSTPKTVKGFEPAKPTEMPKAEANAKQETKEKDPATRVWNKYKALATGTAGEEEQKEDNTPKKPQNPSVNAPKAPEKPSMNAKQENAKPSGLNAILEDWKSNKENQRDMKSRSFSVPKSLRQKADGKS